MKRLFVHCGLHKTGTTALQTFLAASQDDSPGCDLFYPRSGRIGAGHHNVAWELTRDRRFVRAAGDFRTLSAEISTSPGDVAVSSEDFEGVLRDPGAIEKLRRMAIDLDRRLVLILYLRNQIAYWESLFLEMLRHGFGEECALLALETVQTGRVRMKEWTFHFDYLAVVQFLRSFTDIDLVIRPYPGLSAGGIVDDFLSITGIRVSVARYANEPWLNGRDEIFRSLCLFYANRRGGKCDENASTFLRTLSEQFAGQEMRLGSAQHRLFVERFDPGNRQLCLAGSLSPDSLAFAHVDEHDCVRMERLFSFELSNAAHDAPTDPVARRELTEALADWCREPG